MKLRHSIDGFRCERPGLVLLCIHAFPRCLVFQSKCGAEIDHASAGIEETLGNGYCCRCRQGEQDKVRSLDILEKFESQFRVVEIRMYVLDGARRSACRPGYFRVWMLEENPESFSAHVATAADDAYACHSQSRCRSSPAALLRRSRGVVREELSNRRLEGRPGRSRRRGLPDRPTRNARFPAADPRDMRPERKPRNPSGIRKQAAPTTISLVDPWKRGRLQRPAARQTHRLR